MKAEVRGIIARIDVLKPYGLDVQDSVLKIEEVNSRDQQQVQLWSYGISAKRYCLVREAGTGNLELVKASEHGAHFQPGPRRTPATQARLDSILAGYSGRDILEDHQPSGAFPPARFAEVRQWRFPTLFISGTAEEPYWHLVSDSLVKWMPDARRVVIPGGGHGVHFDEPALLNAELLAFLRKIPHRS